MTNPSTHSNDVKAQHGAARDATIFASLFAIFSFGLLLPLLFSFGAPFYSTAGIELPMMTSMFVGMSPWLLVGIAVAICAALCIVRSRSTIRTTRIVNWSSMLFVAAITLHGTLAFLMPVVAIMGGLSS